MPESDKKSRKKRPNLRTVAEHAGLSPTTVSLALRGSDKIPPETRQRVIDAAEALNYKYVARAQNSKSKRLWRLAYVMHDHGDEPVTANPFYGLILSGAEQACRTEQAGLSFVILEYTHAENLPLPPLLRDDLDGILLAGAYPRPLIERVAQESQCPIVLVDNCLYNTPFDSVMADDFGGTYAAISHLIALNHKSILLLRGNLRDVPDVTSFRERERGYVAACVQAGLTPLPSIIIPTELEPYSEPTPEDLATWVEGLLHKYKDVSAIFCVADMYAVRLISTLHKIGLNIPDDLSVLGFDDVNLAMMSQPHLTTVHSYKRAMARAAVERLIQRIEGDDLPPLHIRVGTDLVIRDSITQAKS